MGRTLLILPLAALLAACHSTAPCYAPELVVYWTPGTPQAGFQVPGLTRNGFPAQLGCAEAGVVAVEVEVNGYLQTCAPPFDCRGSRWACTVGGLSIPLAGGGAYGVRVTGYDGATLAANAKYEIRQTVGADQCDATVAGLFPQGLPGPLSLDYAFVGGDPNCQPGAYLWFDVRDPAGASYDYVGPGATPRLFACGGTNPIPLVGDVRGDVAPGVYTLAKMEEAVPADLGATSWTSWHGLYDQLRLACGGVTFVHAGPETLAVDLRLLPPAIASCFP